MCSKIPQQLRYYLCTYNTKRKDVIFQYTHYAQVFWVVLDIILTTCHVQVLWTDIIPYM